MIYAKSRFGEPAEYERVVKGIAGNPKAEQRWLSINGVTQSLPLDHYNCDNCGRQIKPGEQAGTWSVWTDEQQEPPPWEQEFLGGNS